jgi:hypothetical protein
MAGLSRHHHGCGNVHPYSVYTLKCVVLLFLPSWLGGDCCRRAGVAHGITPPLDLDYGLCACFKGLPDSFTEALYRLSILVSPPVESTACVVMQGRLGRVDFRRMALAVYVVCAFFRMGEGFFTFLSWVGCSPGMGSLWHRYPMKDACSLQPVICPGRTHLYIVYT